jgi:hypothetical protein
MLQAQQWMASATRTVGKDHVFQRTVRSMQVRHGGARPGAHLHAVLTMKVSNHRAHLDTDRSTE